MANLSDYIEQLAYLQSGGRPQGQRPIDKINTIFGTLGQGGKEMTDYANQSIKTALEQAQLKKAQSENAPITDNMAAFNAAKAAAGLTTSPNIQGASDIPNATVAGPLTQAQSDISAQGSNNPFTTPEPTQRYSLAGDQLPTLDQAQKLSSLNIKQTSFYNPDSGDFNSTRTTPKDIEIPNTELATILTRKDIAQANADMRKLMIQNAMNNRDLNVGLRQDQQQDRLENFAIQRVVSMRGDQSLARIELQRDATGQAASTINGIETGKLVNSGMVYNDLLGQLWKARTASAPTDQVLKHIQDSTAEGDIAGGFTYVFGKPMGKTTQEILQNVKNFVYDTGDTLDKMHDAYMVPHLIKPTGLNDDRWQRIVSTARGMSFSDFTKGFGNSGIPQIGQVDNGYRFKGGNPKDPNSWEKVQ